jgi:Proto-chlorophyllide reductase 57 kD subunit
VRKGTVVADAKQITWDPEADRRIKRSPFLMRRFIRKRIEERVAGRGRTHVTEADVDESARMYRQYRFK